MFSDLNDFRNINFDQIHDQAHEFGDSKFMSSHQNDEKGVVI